MALPLITDPIDIAVNPLTWDILPTGNLTMTTGIAAVVQGAQIRLKLAAGEWFLNLAQGVPYIARPDGSVTPDQAILGQKFDRPKAIAAFRDQLIGNSARGVTGVPGIVSLPVLDVAFDVNSRIVTVAWKASTAFGDTNMLTLPIGV